MSEDLASDESLHAEEDDEKRKASYYLKQWVVRINLFVMSYMWACCSFTYYMIALQLKYLPGSIYTNAMASGSSELLAYFLGGILYKKLGIKLSFTLLLGLSVVGGLCILFLGNTLTGWMPAFVVIAKFGISGGFVIVYVCTVDVFPTLFCATALGICNFLSRFLTILSPMVAEQPDPIPMVLFTGLSAVGMILI